jgi:hypothetical protein
MDQYIKNISNKTIYKNNYLLAESYKIDEFNTEDMKDITGGVVAIIAPTNSGKSVLLKDLISKTKDNYQEFYLFSRTAKMQKFFDFFPRQFITDDFDEEKLSTIWEKQVELNEQGRSMPKILVILDDIIASPSYKKSKMLEECSISARHLNITVILLSQNFTSIKPIVRNNIRIAIAFQMASKKERDKFSEQFLSADNAMAGDLLLKRITGVKYQCIIVQVYKNGESLSDKVKRYIASPDVIVEFPEEKHKCLKMEHMIETPRVITKKKKY